MKVEKLEKKIIFVIAVIGAVAVVAATLVYQKKSLIEQASPPEASLRQVYDGVLTTNTSSNIEVGKAKGSGTVITTTEVPSSGKVTEIKWEELYKLDYKTGKAPDSLKKLNKTKVRIPGFIVPLSDDFQTLKEFLLVPNAQACIHVPPPPPNLIVYVILDKAISSEKVFNPSWVEGTLLIESTNSEYGAASYKLLAQKMEKYKF